MSRRCQPRSIRFSDSFTAKGPPLACSIHERGTVQRGEMQWLVASPDWITIPLESTMSVPTIPSTFLPISPWGFQTTMSTVIACPKCKTKYKLPPSLIGKPIQCKKCGARFKTQASSPTGQSRPAGHSAKPTAKRPKGAASRSQVSPDELKKLGIDGPIGRRNDDLFGGAAPVSPRGPDLLGNYAADPGFEPLETPRPSEQVPPPDRSKPTAEFLRNPAMETIDGATVRKKSATTPAVTGDYSVARIGIWTLLVSLAVIGISLAFLVLLEAGITFLPDTMSKLSFVRPAIIGMFILQMIGGVGFLIGTAICIGSPQRDEKIAIGISFGSLLLAVCCFLVAVILLGMIGALLHGAENPETRAGVSGAAGAIGGLLFLLGVGLWIAHTAFLFRYFRRLGDNIRSQAVIDATKRALQAWLIMIVVGILGGIILRTLVSSGGEGGAAQSTLLSDLTDLLNGVLRLVVIGMSAMMAYTPIRVLGKK